jgi:NTE family protein/lysophospholipid hydrolase
MNVERTELLKALTESKPLESLSQNSLVELVEQGEALCLEQGEQLSLRRGDHEGGLFVVVSGRLSFISKSASGGEQVLDEMSCGDFVGDFITKIGGNSKALLVAAEPAQLFTIPLDALNKLFTKQPEAELHFDVLLRQLVYRAQLAVHLSDLFEIQAPSAFSELVEEVEWRSLCSGEVLYRQNDPGDSVYIVLAGRMRASVKERDGKQRIVNEMTAGETVGEVALLTSSQRAATLIAARDTVLARLSSAAFEKLTDRYPRIMLQIARLIGLRLRKQWSDKKSLHSRGATFVIVPIHHEFDVDKFVSSLFETLKFTGSTACFNAEQVDLALGHKGISNEPCTSTKSTQIAQWFHEQEVSYQNIILIADGPWSSWCERAIRQADHVLLVADSESDVELCSREKKINALWDFSSHLKQSLVLLHPPETKEISGTERWLKERRLNGFYHVKSDSPDDFARLARILTGQANALVLGGGGARGYAHIGVLRALEENGVPIDMVCGTSIGAIIAAGVALEYDSKKISAVCSQYFRRFFDYTLPVISLIRGRKIEQNLHDALGDKQIEDLPLPFFCISTNLTRAEQVVHNKGSLTGAIRASMSLPAMVPPVYQSGDLLVDGGVLNNLPIDVMYNLCSGGNIIAVDISPKIDLANNDEFSVSVSGLRLLLERLNPFRSNRYRPSIFDVLSRSITLAAVNRSMRQEEQDLASLYLLLPVETIGTLEYDELERISNLGYTSSIKQVTEWCQGHERD